jgi:hypothetical protein
MGRETSRCNKYGGLNETVPRHTCTIEWCEFDFPEVIQDNIRLWEMVGLKVQVEQEQSKLKFAQERAGKA